MSQFKQTESESNKNFLWQIPIFQNRNIDNIKNFCEVSVYAQGDCILKEGQEPDYFYMVKQGKVKVEKKITV